MKPRVWIPLLVVVLVFGVGLVARVGARQVQPEDRTATVERGPIEVFVTGTGKVEPAAQASLSFRTNGTLGELNVAVGDQVRNGQLLASLDPSSLDANLLSARADLISAQQVLDDLLSGPTPQQLAQAEAAVAQARDALDTAQDHRSVQQEGNRASSTTVKAAEAELTLAEDAQANAKHAYDSCGSSDDPQCAQLYKNYAAAVQRYWRALANLNWYTGHPTDIQQAILDSDVATAQANLAQAQEDLDKLRGAPDQEEVQKAEARVLAAQSVVDQSRLVSPIDGTVLSTNHTVGDTVTPGEIEIVIADLSELHINTTIDELDIAQVEEGQRVDITLDALPDLELQGQVASIDLSPEVGAGGTQYPVRVQVDSPDQAVRIGMTAALSISVAEEQQAVLVPNWALRLDSVTGEIYVTVHQGTQRERRVVELGLRNETDSQVLSGVEPGEVIGVTIEQTQRRPAGGFFGGG